MNNLERCRLLIKLEQASNFVETMQVMPHREKLLHLKALVQICSELAWKRKTSHTFQVLEESDYDLLLDPALSPLHKEFKAIAKSTDLVESQENSSQLVQTKLVSECGDFILLIFPCSH